MHCSRRRRVAFTQLGARLPSRCLAPPRGRRRALQRAKPAVRYAARSAPAPAKPAFARESCQRPSCQLAGELSLHARISSSELGRGRARRSSSASSLARARFKVSRNSSARARGLAGPGSPGRRADSLAASWPRSSEAAKHIGKHTETRSKHCAQ